MSGKSVKSFDQDTRLNILKIGNLLPVKISSKHIVVMKVDLTIPCEKLKTISRYLVHIEHLKTMAKISNSFKEKFFGISNPGKPLKYSQMSYLFLLRQE